MSREKVPLKQAAKVFSGISSINNLSQGSANNTTLDCANTNHTFETRATLKDKGSVVMAHVEILYQNGETFLEPTLIAFNTGFIEPLFLGFGESQSLDFKLYFKLDPVLTAMLRQCSM